MGMAETSPMADTPCANASRASSKLEMQQILTNGLDVNSMDTHLC